MTDINAAPLDEEAMRQAIELLYFAYREFTAEPDAILAELGFGRAHHRVIYFVGRNPGIPVSELLAILRITKQSLARVLSQLLAAGIVAQATGMRDRRQRLLTLSPEGVALERLLTRRQGARIASAYARAGGPAVEGFQRVLQELAGAAETRSAARFARGNGSGKADAAG